MYNFDKDAKVLWEYHHLNCTITKSDCIIGFGSHDLHVAERAADLLLNGYGHFLIFTGGLGRITKNIWHIPEARKFANIAIERGVPENLIAVEDQSTNTGENIRFTQNMILTKKFGFSDFIVVDKPFKERRIYATLKKQWPSLKFVVASPPYSYEDYKEYYSKSSELSVADFINIMVGDLQRIDLYGKNGFQIPQEIPLNVWDSFNRLVEHGFSEQLI